MKSDEQQIYRFLLATDFVNRTLSMIYCCHMMTWVDDQQVNII